VVECLLAWLDLSTHQEGETAGTHLVLQRGRECSGGGGTDEATGGMMVVVGSNVRVAHRSLFGRHPRGHIVTLFWVPETATVVQLV
jgi:hypothetical protein